MAETPVWVEDGDGGVREAVVVGHELVLCPIVRYNRSKLVEAGLRSAGVDIPLTIETVHPRDVSPREKEAADHA